MPSEKNDLVLASCKVIFPNPEKARKNMSDGQISARVLCFNHRITNFYLITIFRF